MKISIREILDKRLRKKNTKFLAVLLGFLLADLLAIVYGRHFGWLYFLVIILSIALVFLGYRRYVRCPKCNIIIPRPFIALRREITFTLMKDLWGLSRDFKCCPGCGINFDETVVDNDANV